MKFDPRIIKLNRVPRCGPTTKRMFKSHEAAIQFIGERRGTDGMRAYRCPFCGEWHLTSKPDKFS